MEPENDNYLINDTDVAIIALSGRFPGAKDVDTFWENLKAGVESISFFSEQELLESGVNSNLLKNPNYVKASAIVEDIDMFDANFFDFSPREAEILDPQQRLFLECAWEAIEKAGYDPQTYKGLIGVYAGVGINSYLLNNLIYRRDILESVGEYQVVLDSDKDFLPSRVAYKLNLKGPAVNIQTACSTSLVAVHVAMQSLLNGECDMALAGGITLRAPQKNGYLYQEGMILSPDGHCRVFDAEAKGTVGGNGVGIVVLKRLADAIADGDCVHAIIKGSAINNDGSFKVGYTAPSIEGQATVIAEALALAQVDAQSITYIEAHGTGTELGDPIELAALNKVFQQRTEKKQFCAIGSLKSNMGHLDTAAGVAGLIKTVLALKHKLQPPSLHFTTPNPKIDFANSPFYVNTKLSEWKSDDFPCRAGVSSFGIGGTNAHVILEEAPEVTPSGKSRPWQLLPISAKTSSALNKATANLGEHLQQNPDLNLADVAYTFSCGRQAFNHRRILVTQEIKETANALLDLDAKKVFSNTSEPKERDVVFFFPAQGAQYINMALELYQTEPVFQQQVDLCSQILQPLLQLDIRQIIYPKQELQREAIEQLQQKAIAEVGVFVIEYALAQLLLSWGILPQAMVGHGVGEYVAACLAEVFSLEAALGLVAGKPISNISLNPPKIPYISNLTGTWITAEQATNPNYYTQHLRQKILETQEIENLSLEAEQILLEVGPGKTLNSELVFKTVRPDQENQSDVAFLLTTLGHLWLAGVKIDWSGFYSQEQRYRVPLPTYPFERQRYWISPPDNLHLSSENQVDLTKKPDIADWFYIPSWKRLPLPVNQSEKLPKQILLFSDEFGLGEELGRELIQKGIEVISVKVGASFSKEIESLYTLNPQQPKDYQALIAELQTRNFIPEKFVHLWSVTDENYHQELDANLVDKASELGFYSLLFFVQACSQKVFLSECEITVITSNIQDVTGSEILCPEKATILGTLQNIPQEYPNFTCRAIDVIVSEKKQQLIEQLAREITTNTTERTIAYRRQNRWVQTFEKFPLALPTENKQLRDKGVYLITGGLSYLGFSLAKHLAKKVKAKLILTGRSGVPAREDWSTWLANHDEQDTVSSQIRKVQELEELGAEVLVIKADVADLQQMEAAINQAEQRFGSINGVIHAAGAGAIWGQSINVIENITKEECQNQFTAKIYGTLVLAKILQNREIDFCMLTSSLSAILGGLGFVAYAAVNTFMDAFVHKYNQASNYPWISVDWDGWQSNQKILVNNQGFGDEISELEITAEEGVKAFEYLLSGHKCSQLIVSTVELEPRINLWVKRGLSKKSTSENITQKTSGNYIAPRNKTEEKIATIFQYILGINQVSIHDSFLELGGDSLTGTQLLSQLKQTFAINLPISTVFESPTIGQLAEVIDSQQKLAQNDIDKISDILKMVESLSEDEIGVLAK